MMNVPLQLERIEKLVLRVRWLGSLGWTRYKDRPDSGTTAGRNGSTAEAAANHNEPLPRDEPRQDRRSSQAWRSCRHLTAAGSQATWRRQRPSAEAPASASVPEEESAAGCRRLGTVPHPPRRGSGGALPAGPRRHAGTRVRWDRGTYARRGRAPWSPPRRGPRAGGAPAAAGHLGGQPREATARASESTCAGPAPRGACSHVGDGCCRSRRVGDQP